MHIFARTFVSLALDALAAIYALLVQAAFCAALLFTLSPAVVGLNADTGLLTPTGLVVLFLILRFCVQR